MFELHIFMHFCKLKIKCFNLQYLQDTNDHQGMWSFFKNVWGPGPLGPMGTTPMKTPPMFSEQRLIVYLDVRIQGGPKT